MNEPARYVLPAGVAVKSLREYWIWRGMRIRCHTESNKDYKHYGQRGIYVCERWRWSFATFIWDMGPRPDKTYSIDRLDNDGPYSPENCRWATHKEQRRNSRQNTYITIYGVRKCLCEWLEHFGIIKPTYQVRIKLGWSVEEALTTPVREKK